MSHFLLGVIAAAVLVMAAIQVAVIVFAVSAAKRLGAAAERLERDVRPIMQNLESLTADAARASSLTREQLERADRLFADVSRRLEHLLTFVPSVLGSAGKGVAFLGGLKAVLAIVRELRRTGRSRKRRPRSPGEDAFFTG